MELFKPFPRSKKKKQTVSVKRYKIYLNYYNFCDNIFFFAIDSIIIKYLQFTKK